MHVATPIFLPFAPNIFNVQLSNILSFFSTAVHGKFQDLVNGTLSNTTGPTVNIVELSSYIIYSTSVLQE